MEAFVTYRNLFPFQDNPEDKETTVPQSGVNFDEIEKEAVLWTPPGMYLYKIKIPGQTITYTKEGKRTAPARTPPASYIIMDDFDTEEGTPVSGAWFEEPIIKSNSINH